MSCNLIKALGRRRFDFGFLAGSASQSVTLLPIIDSCEYNFVSIQARVHQRSMASGQSLNFHLYNTLPSDEDGREFIETEQLTAVPLPLLTLTLTSDLPFGVPGISYNNSSNPGPYLKLVLTATQASSPSNFYIETSALVLMRNAGR